MKLGSQIIELAAGLMLGLVFLPPSLAESLISPKFVIAPYVFSQHGEGLSLGFSYGQELTVPRRVTVNFFDGNAMQEIEATSHAGQFLVRLPIAQCGFGNKVTYRVPGMAADVGINEIPCPGQNDNARFTFIADTQEGVASDRAFAEAIRSFNGAALVVGGDLVENGSASGEWLKFFNALEPVIGSQVLVPVVGNHEYRHVASVPLWKRYFDFDATDGYYAVDVGAVHIMVLNSAFWNDSSLPLRQLVWIKNELEKSSKFKIVTFHHPPFTRSIFSSRAYPKKEYKELQAEYVPLFEEYRVDLVLNGHTHIYEHSYKSGVHYMTTGAAGGEMGFLGGKNPYEVRYSKVRTMVQVETSSTGLRATSKTLEGRIVESIYIQK